MKLCVAQKVIRVPNVDVKNVSTSYCRPINLSPKCELQVMQVTGYRISGPIYFYHFIKAR